MAFQNWSVSVRNSQLPRMQPGRFRRLVPQRRSCRGRRSLLRHRSHHPLFQANCLWELLRSEEHTSELQSQSNLVCRLLLEKKKNNADIQFKDKLISCVVIAHHYGAKRELTLARDEPTIRMVIGESK